jgi:Uma2 family endonuclease
MANAPATLAPWITAEEFARRPDPGHPEELVRGRIVPMPMPKPRHGEICGQAYYLLRREIEDRDLGRLLSNDSGVITQRGPDTVRGADIAYYSYERVPKGPLPDRYLDVAPDLILEVRSPSDRWADILVKVGEYLAAGVTIVVVLDDTSRSARVFDGEGTIRLLAAEEEFTLPELLGDFSVSVRRFFE